MHLWLMLEKKRNYKMKREKRKFNVEIEEGDAIIRLKNDKIVQLVFAEDGDTIAREFFAKGIFSIS